MTPLIKASLFNVVFVIFFIGIYGSVAGAAYLSFYYLLGISVLSIGWLLPHWHQKKSLVNFPIKASWVWTSFFIYLLFILKLRGITLGNITSMFDDRGEFVASQEGMGIFFIVFFEIFFGYWLATFFKKNISGRLFLFLILVYTLLSYSRSYFFYFLTAYFVTNKLTFKNVMIFFTVITFSVALLLIRFNTIDIASLANNSIFVELFTKYPFVGIARLGIKEDVQLSFYNYFSALIMPYDVLTYGLFENILGLGKGNLAFSRNVGEELSQFKEIYFFSNGAMSSFNAFGTILFPFKTVGKYSLALTFFCSLFNSMLFKIANIDRKDAVTILSFLLSAGILISFFNTLILFGLMLGYLFPYAKKCT